MNNIKKRPPRLRNLSSLNALRPSELACLREAGNDKTCAQTATALNLSIETVRTYRKRALEKLGCRTVAGALMVVMDRGLLGEK